MRKIINSTYISLDGVIEAPHLWPDTEGSDPDGERIQTELLHSCDAVVMGRRTYEGFAPVWPTRSGDPYSDRINSMPKYVVSSTLKDPEWNNTTVIDGDPAARSPGSRRSPARTSSSTASAGSHTRCWSTGSSTSCGSGSTRS